jgi:hypothetical protein
MKASYSDAISMKLSAIARTELVGEQGRNFFSVASPSSLMRHSGSFLSTCLSNERSWPLFGPRHPYSESKEKMAGFMTTTLHLETYKLSKEIKHLLKA